MCCPFKRFVSYLEPSLNSANLIIRCSRSTPCDTLTSNREVMFSIGTGPNRMKFKSTTVGATSESSAIVQWLSGFPISLSYLTSVLVVTFRFGELGKIARSLLKRTYLRESSYSVWMKADLTRSDFSNHFHFGVLSENFRSTSHPAPTSLLDPTSVTSRFLQAKAIFGALKVFVVHMTATKLMSSHHLMGVFYAKMSPTPNASSFPKAGCK